MTIQTAGQQRYYDFVEERAKKLQTGMIVWISLLCVALICLFSNAVLAIVLGVAGAFLGYSNMKSQNALKGKLNQIDDREEFFAQLSEEDTIDVKDAKLVVARDYVMVMKTDLMLYQLKDMEKLEVGIQKGVQKTLFLTDRDGYRHEIMSCSEDSEMQQAFDAVYHKLHERLN